MLTIAALVAVGIVALLLAFLLARDTNQTPQQQAHIPAMQTAQEPVNISLTSPRDTTDASALTGERPGKEHGQLYELAVQVLALQQQVREIEQHISQLDTAFEHLDGHEGASTGASASDGTIL